MILELLSQSTMEGKSRSWFHNPDESMNYHHMEFRVPKGLDLSSGTEDASKAALWGIEVSWMSCLIGNHR